MSNAKITWQQGVQQMNNNIDAVLDEGDKEFVLSLAMLAESGHPIAQTLLPRLTNIYAKFLTLINTKTSSDLQSDAVNLQTSVNWLEAVREMNDNTVMILDDDDKEFVMGIALMLEMNEPVSTSYAPRVEAIYKKYRYHQDL